MYTVENFPDKGLIDKLINLKIEKYKHGDRYCCIAPTWLVSEKVELSDFLDDFADPIKKQDALRDYGCIPSSSLRPFFPDPQILINNANPNRVQMVDSTGLISQALVPYSAYTYYIGCDLAITRDRIGLSMVHREFAGDSDIYVLDFSVQFVTSMLESIDYNLIRNIIRQLRKRKFRIGCIGFDQFQSHDSAVIMEQEGFNVQVVSYHESLAGCGVVRDLVYGRQIVYGICDSIFIGEAGELQILNNRRVDHLESGGIFNSKDVWDSVVNACVLASQQAPPFKAEYLSAK